ncbi:hypothetical protein BGZ63DRAFT_379293 [Mariannaea sp. PMI_226]|nr:hypothetical protein BGZ63DRAFT_379293 [Mariannaea sp. PMI_226]
MGKSKTKNKETSGDTTPPASNQGFLTERPGTSGTENLLITNRRQASQQYIKAQRAERAYRTKKHATLAHANYNETKAHFHQAFFHFKLAMKGFFSVLKSAGYLIGEKRENRRQIADTKKRQKNLEKKMKLEEVLAKEEGVDDKTQHVAE